LSSERIGPYRIESKLGAGGMGEVYKAYDERLDRWVALKRISPDRCTDAVYRERLLREARASARLSHPAIVQVFDLVQADGADCIVMELVEGTPLSLLLRQGRLELPRALALAREITAALAMAHACGIVHRDLKTENVMVTPDGHAKILDFGISKRLGAGESEPSLTLTGAVVGTVRAMAPEQAQGKDVDHRADLFALGVLLYEMVTARSPFEAASAATTLYRLCYEPHTPLRKLDARLPADLSFLVDRLLEKRPEGRPAGAGEVAATLAALCGEPRQDRTDDSVTVLEMPSPVKPASGAGSPSSAERRQMTVMSSAERRQVTVLSCGLVRATGGPSDPEEMIEAMLRLQALAAETARRFEGRAAPGMGEDCRLYFGDLQAHEDDARRAVHTALELVSSCRDWQDGFAVRIGIHTGPMVVTRAAAPEAAFGDIPGIAALLRSVVVSDSTLPLIEGYFECEELTALALQTMQRPLRTYRVVAERAAHNRVQSAGALTPLVAREQELGLLLARWELAREGRGQVVLVSGEAGVGKSRLVWELRQRARSEEADWLEGHGSPFHHDSPLYPVAQWLERWTGTDRADSPESRLERLAEALSRHGMAPEAVPLLAALLSLPASERYPLPPLSPEAQRRKTLGAVATLLLTAAERRPLLLVVEDLHWVDPSTLELLGSLAAQAEAVPLLLVLTFRPEFEPLWEPRSSVTRLTLGLLTRSQAGLMIDRLTEGRRFSPAQREQIAARTDGVPLFIEEMTKMILESSSAGAGQASSRATGTQPSLDIPDTLGGWLMARLDRLGTAKEVAQLAATLGRELSHELLLAVSPWSEKDLDRELDRLVQAELLFRRGLPPRVRYLFKHALLQDAAYASLLKSDRQRHHQRIAETLEASFPEVVETQPELLAHHYTAATMFERAIVFWQRAGERALQASACLEALGHLERALGLLASLPEGGDRDELEIGLQLDLGTVKGVTQSPASPEAGEAYMRALELCQRGGAPAQLSSARWGLFTYHAVRAQARQALELARQFLDMDMAERDLTLRINALEAVGFCLLCMGDLVEARSHLETLIALGRPQASASDSLRFRHRIVDPFLGGMAYLSVTLCLLGYPDQALECSREALELRRHTPFVFTQGLMKYWSGEVHILRREPHEVQPLAHESVDLAAEQDLPFFWTTGNFQLGWATAEKGDVEAGIEMMQQGVNARLAAGMNAGSVTHFCFLATHLLNAGRFAEGLTTVERALAISSDGGHCIMDAELYRLKGELIQGLGAAADEVEAESHRALEIARLQGARWLELRAAMSLARLWCRQGKKTAAHGLLASVYGWFTEGLDTRDLQEARSLLAELV
jgi:tetratricopeptide (TPR) repeat protein